MSDTTKADSIRVGDLVRKPQGRIRWTVTRVSANRYGYPMATLRSERGSRNRSFLNDLDLVERRSTGDAWETLPDGVTLRNGQPMTNPNHYVHTTVEWRWPHYDGQRDAYDDQRPKSVSAIVCKADDNGERWLTIDITEPGVTGGVGLRKDAALALGLALVKMSSYLGDDYTPGR